MRVRSTETCCQSRGDPPDHMHDFASLSGTTTSSNLPMAFWRRMAPRRALERPIMQDTECRLRRIPLPRTPLNKLSEDGRPYAIRIRKRSRFCAMRRASSPAILPCVSDSNKKTLRGGTRAMYQTNPTEMFRERELLLMRRKIQARRHPPSQQGGGRRMAAFGRMIASWGRTSTAFFRA